MIEAPTGNSGYYKAAGHRAEYTPVGYKRTEVGVIPQDWEVASLRTCLSADLDYGIGAAAIAFDGTSPAYLRITDIGEDFRYRPSPRVSVNHPERKSYLLEDGDLVFARTGASVGKSYLYNPIDGPLVFAGFLVRSKPRPERLNSVYCSYIVQSQRYWQWISAMSSRSGQPGVNGQEYGSFLLPLPKILEQGAIAQALSDVDKLLESLDALIAKKRAIKQAAMQQLLTGKTRLPGFSGAWENKAIGVFAECIAGGTPNTSVSGYWNGTIRWMNSGELNKKLVKDVVGRITEKGLRESSASVVPPRCVLVGLAGQGKTRGTVAFSLIDLCTNQSIAAILPNDTFSPEYLYFNLDSRYEELRSMSTGDGGRGGLNLSIIRSILVPFPDIDEQQEIAIILSDIDSEITALEQRHDKTRAIKAGMMQQLLTGRVRLIEPSDQLTQTEVSP